MLMLNNKGADRQHLVCFICTKNTRLTSSAQLIRTASEQALWCIELMQSCIELQMLHMIYVYLMTVKIAKDDKCLGWFQRKNTMCEGRTNTFKLDVSYVVIWKSIPPRGCKFSTKVTRLSLRTFRIVPHAVIKSGVLLSFFNTCLSSSPRSIAIWN